MRKLLIGAVPVLATMLLAGAPVAQASPAFPNGMEQAASSENDAKIQAELQKSLGKSQFKSVQVQVQGGVVTLTGTVDRYWAKEEADKKAHRAKNVTAVRNDVQVAGPEIPDQQLQEKLVKELSTDRVGYGTNAFNAIGVNVQNGVVSLSGHAYGPTDKESALGLVMNTPGVKDVIDDVEVDPVSPLDDRIRLQTARAIYGYPMLQKYAIDPANPIRISVQNGNVTLFGVVLSKADKDVAGIRANGVPGVFKVTNDLQVANEGPEK
jgi:hyperosmotically inducible protein